MFEGLSPQFGINIWVFILVLIWSAVWKLLAMWKAARKNSPVWFVVLFLISTIGILEILYFYVFSEMNLEKLKKENPSKKVKKSKKK